MDLFKNGLDPIGEDYREGITSVVSVQVPEPQFESQTKIKLNNPEVEVAVSSAVYEFLQKYLEENPEGSHQDHEEGDLGSRGTRGSGEGEEGP